MTTPEELAKEIHAHAVKQVRRHGGWTTGILVSSDGGSPPTVTITLKGSSTQISDVSCGTALLAAVAANPSSFLPVVVLVGREGDLLVLDAIAS